MKADYVFIDKTLGYCLKSGNIKKEATSSVMNLFTEVENLVFDIPFEYISSGMDLTKVRCSVSPDKDKIQEIYEMGGTWIKLSLNSKKFENFEERTEEAVKLAEELGMKVSLGCINIIKKPLDKIHFIATLVNKFHITSAIVHDFDSCLDPISTFVELEKLYEIIPCEIEYGGKNRLGLATGNTLGAVKARIRLLQTSIGGIGDFPAMEEVMMSMKHLLSFPIQTPYKFSEYCRNIVNELGLKVLNTKPIIGSGIFSHESGIHVDGVIKRSDLYEPFTPEEVGLKRKIVIGKHSGRAAIEEKIKELKIAIKEESIVLLLDKVRSLAVKQKAAITDIQFERLVKEVSAHVSKCC